MVLIKPIEEVDAGDLAEVGGKGANLGELVRAGLPVPRAFCVTTEAYRRFLTENGLDRPIADVLGGIDYSDPAGIEASASQIRSMMTEAPIPADLAAAVSDAYAALEADLGGELAVSVRSSATAEDLPGMSFAGQQDTYLDVAGIEQVLDAVRRCWASLWTDRAIVYRHHQGFDHAEVFLAVVVQEMFPSEVSGVMFTANPVSSNPNELFLNLSWGLGEAVVSGQVNPDQLIIDKDSLAIIDRQINDKAVMTGPQGAGLVPVPGWQRKLQTLPDDEVTELCKLGRRIEDHYGFYQDIEWGYSGGRFAILQAREITGANLDFGHELEVWKSPRAMADMYDERWTWSRAYSDEVQTGPSTPSFYTYLQNGMSGLKTMALLVTGQTSFEGYERSTFADFPYFRWYGARAYYNLAFERERIRRFIPPFARNDAALWPFPESERDEIRNLPFDWDEFHALLRRLHETKPDISLLGTTGVMYEGLERWTDQEDAFWQDVDLDGASVAELFEAQSASRGDSRFGGNVCLPFTIYLYLLPSALEIVCQEWLDDDGTIYNRLVGGLQTKTSEENIAVWALAESIAVSPSLTEIVQGTTDDRLLEAFANSDEGMVFVDEFNAFVDRYGHRGGAERDAYHLRWRDDPSLVFGSIRLMLNLDANQAPEAHETRQRDLMQKTRQECLRRLAAEPERGETFEWLVELNSMADSPATTRVALFEWLVDLVQDYFYYRDFERFYNDKTMSRSRPVYEAIGRRFTANGLLEDGDDVFFLGRQEMLAADRGSLGVRQIATRVRERRRVYDRHSRQEPPKYIRGWEFFDDDIADGTGALRGIAASSGVTTGRARVCRELEEIGTIEPGDILVTVATDPGWTTVFSIINAVVVETGGVVAHAVMISREYGLPCVANLSRACNLIPDGATITVDGNTGTVVVHDSA